jgi:hypothetical protein
MIGDVALGIAAPRADGTLQVVLIVDGKRVELRVPANVAASLVGDIAEALVKLSEKAIDGASEV